MNSPTILVIVDNTLVYEAMRGLLRTWGYRVTRTNHYEPGQAREVNAPDLVLIDVEERDGDTLLNLIGDVSQRLGVIAPILVLSKEDSDKYIRRLHRAGMGLYAIHKPVLPDVLRREIRFLLGRMASFAW